MEKTRERDWKMNRKEGQKLSRDFLRQRIQEQAV